MFPAEEKGKWEPYRIRTKAPRKRVDLQEQSTGTNDAHAPAVNGATEDEAIHEEDPESDVGAVWPIQGGRIVNWPCFFAFMHHVHNMLGAGFHTPILLISQPAWTPLEHIKLTSFFFEKFKCPAFALMDSAQALCYAYGVHTACVIDIGKDKADITAVTEFLVNDVGRGLAVSGLGGDAMTQNLVGQLEGQGYDREMCEQLKMSSICEILPEGTPLPGPAEPAKPDIQPAVQSTNPASAVSTGADGSGPDRRHSGGATGDAPRGPAVGNETRADEQAEEDKDVDIAALVASGKLKEHLAKKEKAKAERAAARRKGKAAAANPAEEADKLRNARREYNTFVFHDRAAKERAKDGETGVNGHAPVGDEIKSTGPLRLDTQQTNGTATAPSSATTEAPPQSTVSTTAPSLPPTSPTTASAPAPITSTKNPYSRTLTVGPTRFSPLPLSYLPTLAAHIHSAINAAALPPTIRQTLWDHVLLTGSGARVHGFKEALLAHLAARYVVSPNSASIFTSEPPSSFGTPGGTGANTPMPGGVSGSQQMSQLGMAGQMPLPQLGGSSGPGGGGGGVNPLLHAATTAAFNRPPQQQNTANLMPTPQRPLPGGNPSYSGTPGSMQTPPPGYLQQRPMQISGVGHAHTGQTPTSVKTGRLPEYFSEWKEEASPYGAVFLGAQVAAKCLFLADDRVRFSHSCFTLCISYLSCLSVVE